MAQNMLTDLKYLIDEHIIQEITPRQKFQRLYTLRFSDGWIDQRLHKLATDQNHNHITQDVKHLQHKYPTALFKNSIMLNEFEAILDHTLAILQHAHTPATLNDQQQAEFVTGQLSASKSMYTIYFNRIQPVLSPFQNQIINLYNLLRKIIFLNKHHVAWTYFGFDVMRKRLLHPTHARNLHFQHMLIPPEHLQQKTNISFMGLTDVFQHQHLILISMINSRKKATFFEMIGKVRKYFPQLSAEIEALEIHSNYKNQMLDQLFQNLQHLYQYIQEENIIAIPQLDTGE
jgi:hypothetical protein